MVWGRHIPYVVVDDVDFKEHHLPAKGFLSKGGFMILRQKCKLTQRWPYISTVVLSLGQR